LYSHTSFCFVSDTRGAREEVDSYFRHTGQLGHPLSNFEREGEPETGPFLGTPLGGPRTKVNVISWCSVREVPRPFQ
jgi:hypothetical protein